MIHIALTMESLPYKSFAPVVQTRRSMELTGVMAPLLLLDPDLLRAVGSEDSVWSLCVRGTSTTLVIRPARSHLPVVGKAYKEPASRTGKASADDRRSWRCAIPVTLLETSGDTDRLDA